MSSSNIIKFRGCWLLRGTNPSAASSRELITFVHVGGSLDARLSYTQGVNRCKVLGEAQQPSGVMSFLVIFSIITSPFTKPARSILVFGNLRESFLIMFLASAIRQCEANSMAMAKDCCVL
jgi:hypothetical protein